MDGLLIDTEPVWRAAQSAVFAGFGVALSASDLLDSTGRPVEELIPIWRRSPAPDPAGTELTDAEVAGLIVDRVIAHVKAEGQPMPGVTAAIALFERCGLRLAIASSSPLRLIDAVCDRLGLTRITVRCFAVPDPLLAADPRYREADLVLESLTGLDEAALRRLGVPVPG